MPSIQSSQRNSSRVIMHYPPHQPVSQARPRATPSPRLQAHLPPLEHSTSTVLSSHARSPMVPGRPMPPTTRRSRRLQPLRGDWPTPENSTTRPPLARTVCTTEQRQPRLTNRRTQKVRSDRTLAQLPLPRATISSAPGLREASISVASPAAPTNSIAAPLMAPEDARQANYSHTHELSGVFAKMLSDMAVEQPSDDRVQSWMLHWFESLQVSQTPPAAPLPLPLPDQAAATATEGLTAGGLQPKGSSQASIEAEAALAAPLGSSSGNSTLSSAGNLTLNSHYLSDGLTLPTAMCEEEELLLRRMARHLNHLGDSESASCSSSQASPVDVPAAAARQQQQQQHRASDYDGPLSPFGAPPRAPATAAALALTRYTSDQKLGSATSSRSPMHHRRGLHSTNSNHIGNATVAGARGCTPTVAVACAVKRTSSSTSAGQQQRVELMSPTLASCSPSATEDVAHAH